MPNIKGIKTDNEGNVEIIPTSGISKKLLRTDLEKVAQSDIGGADKTNPNYDLYFKTLQDTNMANPKRTIVKVVDKGVIPKKYWWVFNSQKWKGLKICYMSNGKSDFSQVQTDGFLDVLIANDFNEIRIDIPAFDNIISYNRSKLAVIRAIAKGVKVIWGISGFWKQTITSSNWPILRQGILDAATWAEANGVYEFQIGNEMEFFNDDTTMTDMQLIANLKSVATEVQKIFTRGNISYALNDTNIPHWISVGKGDLDLMGVNIYQGGNTFNDNWKKLLTDFVKEFGSNAYLSEFNLSYTALNEYSTDEKVQATALKEMIDYIKASGITRAFYFVFDDDSYQQSIVKSDGNYRQLWHDLRWING